MAKENTTIKITDDPTLKDDIDYYFKKTNVVGAHRWAEDVIKHMASITNKSSKKDYPEMHKALIPLKYYDDDQSGKNLKKLKAAAKEYEEYVEGVSDPFDKVFHLMVLSCIKSCWSKPDALLTSYYAIAVINNITDNSEADAKQEREWQFEKLRFYTKF